MASAVAAARTFPDAATLLLVFFFAVTVRTNPAVVYLPCSSLPGCSSLGRAWECTKDSIGCHKKIYSPNSPSGDSAGSGRTANRAWVSHLGIPPRGGPRKTTSQPPSGGSRCRWRPGPAWHCQALNRPANVAISGSTHPAQAGWGHDWPPFGTGANISRVCCPAPMPWPWRRRRLGNRLELSAPERTQAGLLAGPSGGTGPGRSLVLASTQIRGKTWPSGFEGPAWSRGPSQLSFRRLFCSPAGPLDRQAWAVRPHRHRTAWIRVG